QRLGSRGQAHLGEVAQQLATDVQSVLDLEAVVKIGIVDQSFPADSGARLLEIDAHDQIQRIADFVRKFPEASRVVLGRIDIVDRAGADDDEQSMVLAVEDVANDLAAFYDSLLRRCGQRNLGLEVGRRNQYFVRSNI